MLTPRCILRRPRHTVRVDSRRVDVNMDHEPFSVAWRNSRAFPDRALLQGLFCNVGGRNCFTQHISKFYPGTTASKPSFTLAKRPPNVNASGLKRLRSLKRYSTAKSMFRGSVLPEYLRPTGMDGFRYENLALPPVYALNACHPVNCG